MYLLDTNVVSELRKRRGDPGVKQWVAKPGQAPQPDALIAGTALARGLIVVTRNTRDFEGTGVEHLNPWSDT